MKIRRPGATRELSSLWTQGPEQAAALTACGHDASQLQKKKDQCHRGS